MSAGRINIDQPRYDQSTFEGRAKHFFKTTNPLNILATDKELDDAKEIVESYRKGKEDKSLTEDQIWAAKELYDSAFHPQTGEKLFFAGRMSFQVPGNMLIVGFMMTFYKSTPAVVFWQIVNQSYMAMVNYTNRNASVSVTQEQLITAYIGATSAGVGTALICNKIITSSPTLSSGIVGRLVPLVAVAAANCANIPLMRQQEVKDGIRIQTEDGKNAGNSTAAAVAALTQVIPSRIGIAAPAMILPAVLMSRWERSPVFTRRPWLRAPVATLIAGFCFTFSTPLCCAFFPQNAAIELKDLEQPLQQKVKEKFPGVNKFYYNKGL